MSEKKAKETAVPNERLTKLLETAIALTEIKLHAAVENADRTPEFCFHETADKPTRRAKLWDIRTHVIIEQKGKYIMVPWSNIIFGVLR